MAERAGRGLVSRTHLQVVMMKRLAANPGCLLCIVLLLAWSFIDLPVCAAQALDHGDGRTPWVVVSSQVGDISGESTSVPEAERDAIRAMERRGYLHARLDSSTFTEGRLEIHVDAGNRVWLEGIALTDASRVPDPLILATLQSLASQPLDLAELEEGVRRVVSDLARRGYPLGTASLEAIEFEDAAESRVSVVVHVDAGEQVDLAAFEIEGSQRIRSSLVSRLTGLQPGRRVESYDPDAIANLLVQSGYVRSAAVGGLSSGPDGLRIHLVLEDAPPGSFDLALGYLPDNPDGGLVGTGHLQLVNPFGGGRDIALRLDRLPGQASRFDARAYDPFVLGTGVAVTIAFSGVQQDSLFNRQSYRIEPGLHLAPGFVAYATGSRETVRPGLAGTRLVAGRQRVSRSDMGVLGAGVRFRRLDDGLNPSRGLAVDLRAERGATERSFQREVNGEIRAETRRVPLQRIMADGAVYRPIGGRQVLRVGVSVNALMADVLDRADLFRVGGAATLRGYDEDRFLTRSAFIASLEVRHRLDRLSFLYGFVDVAYLERPELPDMESLLGVRTGYGLGMRFDAGFGLLSISLALNPADGPQSPRIHAGVSFGL